MEILYPDAANSEELSVHNEATNDQTKDEILVKEPHRLCSNRSTSLDHAKIESQMHMTITQRRGKTSSFTMVTDLPGIPFVILTKGTVVILPQVTTKIPKWLAAYVINNSGSGKEVNTSCSTDGEEEDEEYFDYCDRPSSPASADSPIFWAPVVGIAIMITVATLLVYITYDMN